MKLIRIFLIVIICICLSSTLKAAQVHQDSQEYNLNSPEVSMNSGYFSSKKIGKKYFFYYLKREHERK